MIPSFGKLWWQREWRDQALQGHLELCAEPAGTAPQRSGHCWSPRVTAGGCGDSATTACQLCQGYQLLVPGCSFLLLPWCPTQALAPSLLLPTRLQQPAAPSGSCSQLWTSTSLPQLLHASLSFPFLTQVPFRYLYSVILFPLQHWLSRPYKLNSLSLCPKLILPSPASLWLRGSGFFLFHA